MKGVPSRRRFAERTWALNRLSDSVGNYLTVSYEESNGVYYPLRIDYTGNERCSGCRW